MTTAARVWRRCLFYLNVAVSVPGDDSDTDTGVWLEMRRANRGGGGWDGTPIAAGTVISCVPVLRLRLRENAAH